MGILLLAAFIGVPLLEIGVFVEVGGAIGLWPTLATVILTALLGTWCLRAQGLATLGRARSQLDKGALPAKELFDGACLLVAGALLLTPGFVTDAAGFLLFVPALRDALRGYLARRIKVRMESHAYVHGEKAHGGPRGGTTIDGDFEVVVDPDSPRHPSLDRPERKP